MRRTGNHFVLLGLLLVSALATACSDGRDRPPGGDGSVPFDSGVGRDGDLPADGNDGVDGAAPPSDAAMGNSPLVDPACVDGMYSEALPTPSADISDLISGYSPPAFQSFIDGVLDRRYPIGGYLVEGGRMNMSFGQDCDRLFVGSPTPSVDQVFSRLNTVIHECGHIYDFTFGGFGENGYAVKPGLTLMCSMGDTTSRGGQTFARSLIDMDDYAMLRPGCADDRDPGCDFYWDVYIDPATDGSEQGFNSVLEEALQYVNSLASEYAFADRLESGRSTSAKDGILTFLWYIERYLRLARLEYPEAHAFLLGDPCWRELILTVWGRAWLFLEITRDMSALGINDGQLFPLVEDPVLVEEIQRVRDAHGCTP